VSVCVDCNGRFLCGVKMAFEMLRRHPSTSLDNPARHESIVQRQEVRAVHLRQGLPAVCL